MEDKGYFNKVCVCVCVCVRAQILLMATFPSPVIRVFLQLVQDRVGNTFTKGSISFAFQQKGGEIRVPPVCCF